MTKVLQKRLASIRSGPDLENLSIPSGRKGGLISYLACGIVASALVLGWLGHIEIYAVASARVQPIGKSKPIQVADGGQVVALLVHDGQFVRRGQRLLALDSEVSLADLTSAVRNRASLAAEIVQRNGEIAAAARSPLNPQSLSFPDYVPTDIRTRAQGLYIADLEALRANLAENHAKMLAADLQLQQARANIDGGEKIEKTLGERFGIRLSLRSGGWVAETDVIDAREQLQRQQLQNTDYVSAAAQARGAMLLLKAEAKELITKFLADDAEGIRQASQKLSDAEAGQTKARVSAANGIVRAPVDGFVQQLSIETPRQSVVAGQQVMTIVPAGSKVIVEALILDKDIGFVRPGQAAILKVDAFPFTKYGTLNGVVTSVSRDAVDSKDPGNLQDDVLDRASSSAPSSAQSTKSLVYPVEIQLNQDEFRTDDGFARLQPGMSGSVEIVTGRRRILEYLLSPVTAAVSDAGHER